MEFRCPECGGGLSGLPASEEGRQLFGCASCDTVFEVEGETPVVMDGKPMSDPSAPRADSAAASG